MVELFLEALAESGADGNHAQWRPAMMHNVAELTGQPTLWQMRRLTTEIAARAGRPLTAEQYLHRFDERLQAQVERHLEAMAEGSAARESFLVPGCQAWLATLAERGVTLALASGTDLEHLEREARLLGLAPYFEGRVFGPPGGDPAFSKAEVLARLLSECELDSPAELVSFGDGHVEITATVALGGTAVAVAADESDGRRLDPEKRRRLISSGAHAVVVNYLPHAALLAGLGLAD